MPQPPEIDLLVDRLLAAYRQAQRRIDAEQQAIIDDPSAFRRRARLQEMRDRIDRLMDDADQQARMFVDDDLPKVYLMGADNLAEQMAATSFGFSRGQPGEFTLPSRDALNRLQTGLADNLLQASRGVRDSTKKLVREVVGSEVTNAVLTGTPAMEASRQAADLLDEHGIHAVTYANGARVPIDAYAEMAVRTVSALAYNQGTFDGASGEGVSYFEVFDGPDCGWDEHDSPDLADGTIRSAEECEATPISHVQCRRAFGPRPDIVSDEEAQAAVDAGDTGDDSATVELDDSGQLVGAADGIPRTALSDAQPTPRDAPVAAGQPQTVVEPPGRHDARLAAREAKLAAR